MEILVLVLLVVVGAVFWQGRARRKREQQWVADVIDLAERPATPARPHIPPRKASDDQPARPRTETIKGKAWVIDGDTIVISGTHIRLAGIDAPELDHPWGKKSKFAMVQLCKGQIVTAHVEPHMSYDRIVATCVLEDGRDLAAELVKQGLAIDWPKFSGGKYSPFEPEGVRKKHWRAAAKQKGRYNAARHG